MHCTACGTAAPGRDAAFCWKCGGRLAAGLSSDISAASSSPLRYRASATPSHILRPPASLTSPLPDLVAPKALAATLGLPKAVPPPSVVPHHSPISPLPAEHASRHAPNAAALSPLAVLPPNAPSCETIPLLFAEVDLKAQGRIALDDFRAVLARCNVRLPADDVAEMFRLADTDGDTMLSAAEFHNLCLEYPSLLALLVDRTRLYWVESGYAQDLDAEKQALAQLRGEKARLVSEAGGEGDNGGEGRLADMRKECAQAEARERQTRLDIDAAADERQILKLRHTEDSHRYDVLMGRVAERTTQLQDVAREREQAAVRLRGQQDNVHRAQSRLQELLHLVEEQRSEVGRLEARVSVNEGEISTLEVKHADVERGISEAQAEADAHLVTIAEREAQLKDKERGEGELELAHKKAIDSLSRCLAKMEDAKVHDSWTRESRLNQQRQNEAALRHVNKALEEHTQRSERLRAELHEARTARRSTEEAENASIQLELKLKQQRLQLDRQEAALVASRHVDIARSFSPQRLRSYGR